MVNLKTSHCWTFLVLLSLLLPDLIFIFFLSLIPLPVCLLLQWILLLRNIKDEYSCVGFISLRLGHKHLLNRVLLSPRADSSSGLE